MAEQQLKLDPSELKAVADTLNVLKANGFLTVRPSVSDFGSVNEVRSFMENLAQRYLALRKEEPGGDKLAALRKAIDVARGPADEATVNVVLKDSVPKAFGLLSEPISKYLSALA